MLIGGVGWETPIIIITLHLVELRVDQYVLKIITNISSHLMLLSNPRFDPALCWQKIYSPGTSLSSRKHCFCSPYISHPWQCRKRYYSAYNSSLLVQVLEYLLEQLKLQLLSHADISQKQIVSSESSLWICCTLSWKGSAAL